MTVRTEHCTYSVICYGTDNSAHIDVLCLIRGWPLFVIHTQRLFKYQLLFKNSGFGDRPEEVTAVFVGSRLTFNVVLNCIIWACVTVCFML